MPAVSTPTQYIQGARCISRHQNRVFAKEAGSKRKARDGERSAEQRDRRDLHVLEQAAHLAQILFAVQAVNHRARAQEQQGFEERVRHHMEDAGRKRAHADAQKHIAELRDRGVGETLS